MKLILILAASTLLCIQLVHALPNTKRESVAVAASDNPVSEEASSEVDDASSEEDDASSEEGVPKLILVAYTFAKMALISVWTLDKGSVMLKNTVKELNEIPVKDELLQANITRMSRLATGIPHLDKDEKSDDIIKLFDYTVDFATLVYDYEDMPDDSKLKMTLKTALENNGFIEFQNEFAEKILDFAESLEHSFNIYITELTPAEKSKNSKLVQWHEEFKTDTDEEKKLDKVSEFFDLI